MATDASILLGGKPLNTAGALQNALGNAAGIVQLRGQVQGQRANQAVSAAYQQATDPQTGRVDQQKLIGLISQNPDAAYNLPAIQGQLLQQQNSQVQFDANKFDLAQKQINWMKTGLGSLLASPNISMNDITKFTANGIKHGFLSAEQAATELAGVPADQAQLRGWVQQQFLSAQDGDTQLKALMPQLQTINTGGQQVVSAYNPMTGAPTGQNAVYNNVMSPGEASQPTQVFDPQTGTMRNLTRQQFADMAGGAVGGMQPGMQQQSGILGSGRISQPVGAPGMQAAPALGSQTAAETVAKGSGEDVLSLQRQAEAAPQAIYQFQNMRKALEDINTGPGTDWRTKAASFATALSPEIAAKVGIDPEKISSYEQFNKYATQAAQATLSALGDGTDSKLASAVAANPNAKLSKLGNEHLIDVLVAGQRGLQAKNLAWQNSGLPPEQYGKFSTAWSKEVDPRIFAAQDMDNAKVQAMVNGLSKRDQETFVRSWVNAQQAGYVQ